MRDNVGAGIRTLTLCHSEFELSTVAKLLYQLSYLNQRFISTPQVTQFETTPLIYCMLGLVAFTDSVTRFISILT